MKINYTTKKLGLPALVRAKLISAGLYHSRTIGLTSLWTDSIGNTKFAIDDEIRTLLRAGAPILKVSFTEGYEKVMEFINKHLES